mmetsp:Transcript_244/g.693  ORF Transcript_244/g.693 Transcript_244/m.693 type:complete len:313 (-) Transcript_244:1683-2621(-)
MSRVTRQFIAVVVCLLEALCAGTGNTLDFIVAGAQKAGTTALRMHMQVCAEFICVPTDESHMIETMASGVQPPAYAHVVAMAKLEGRCNSSEGAGSISGITDPKFAYLASHRKLLWRQLDKYNPGIRVVILLREPIQRALSAYNMEVARGGDFREHFGEAVGCEGAHLPMSAYQKRGGRLDYVQRGFYDEQLASLYRVIPTQRILIVVSEHTFSDPLQVYNRIFNFLGVPGVDRLEVVFQRRGSHTHGVSEEVYACLRRAFRQHNDRLYTLLGRSIGDWECWYAEHDAVNSYLANATDPPLALCPYSRVGVI